MTEQNKPVSAAQAFLNKVSPSGQPLSEADSVEYRRLLDEEQGPAIGTGDALREPPNHRFAPIPTKTKM